MKILGTLFHDELNKYNWNKESSHMKKRAHRVILISELAKPLLYFDVYRESDKSRQIHCLLSDSSVIVFNKNSGLIITVIILDKKGLLKYMNHAHLSINIFEKDCLTSCANVNNKRLCKNQSVKNDELENYLQAKKNILSKSNK